ncbi:MAG: hypothetical protein AAFV95_18990 [Bacteroidota bacterium]
MQSMSGHPREILADLLTQAKMDVTCFYKKLKITDMKIFFPYFVKTMLLACILLTAHNVQAQFPHNGPMSTFQGTGIQIFTIDLINAGTDNYLEIVTNFPYENATGLTSLYIDYSGYDLGWRINVGWYIHNGNYFRPSASIEGIYIHDHIKLANKNNKVTIYIPKTAFTAGGRLTVNSLTHGNNLPSNWMHGWLGDKDAVPVAANQVTLSFDNQISSNNNVGIGTHDIPAGYKLAVNGNIICEKVRVRQMVNWPDYVFEPDYDIMPLEELAEYLSTHKHLPEVPSAQEVEKDGFFLEEMDGILLKKVEELTLHLLQKDSELKAIRKEMADLKKTLQQLSDNQK